MMNTWRMIASHYQKEHMAVNNMPPFDGRTRPTINVMSKLNLSKEEAQNITQQLKTGIENTKNEDFICIMEDTQGNRVVCFNVQPFTQKEKGNYYVIMMYDELAKENVDFYNEVNFSEGWQL